MNDHCPFWQRNFCAEHHLPRWMPGAGRSPWSTSGVFPQLCKEHCGSCNLTLEEAQCGKCRNFQRLFLPYLQLVLPWVSAEKILHAALLFLSQGLKIVWRACIQRCEEHCRSLLNPYLKKPLPLHPGSCQPWKNGRACQAWEASLLPWIDSWHFQRGRWGHRGTRCHLSWPLLQQPLDCPRFGKNSHPGPGCDKRFASPSAETRMPVCCPICWPFCTIPLETCCTSVWGCAEAITSRLENVQRPVLSSGPLLHFEWFAL